MSDLPIIPVAHAVRLRLVTVDQLAKAYRTGPGVINRFLGKPTAPTPVGWTEPNSKGKKVLLYEVTAVINWVDSLDGPASISGRRRTAPVVNIGTNTPTAGKPYVWRDPARGRRR